MISNKVSYDAHTALLDSKYDASVERYTAGRLDIVDRYNITSVLVQGPNVLDVGCGECLLARLLLDNSKTVECVTGIDASEEMIVRAEEFIGEHVDLHVGYAENLPFDDGQFDTVVLGQILEHVVDVGGSIRESLRVLKPGGRLIVNVPSDDKVPHGNHLHAFMALNDLLIQFGDSIEWEGKGLIHNYYNAWGAKK